MSQESTEAGRSPLAGCAIFIAIFISATMFITLSIIPLFRQGKAIAAFTSTQAQKVTSLPSSPASPELTSLQERLNTFKQSIDNKQAASLSLSTDELNLAIANFDSLKDFRGTLHVRNISEKHITFDIAFQINGTPRLAQRGENGWLSTDKRYLNAALLAKPVLHEKELMLKVIDVQVTNRAVPHEFIEQMSPYRIAERYLTDSSLGPIMAKLSSVDLHEHSLTFNFTPGLRPKEEISSKQVDSAAARLFKVFSIAFLAFAAFAILIGLLVKKRR